MKLIIFDCDGTLVDSQHHIVEAMTTAFTDLNVPVPTRQDILSVVGLSLPEAIFHIYKEGSPDQIEALSEAYKSAYMAMRQRPGHMEPLYDGAKSAIEELASYDNVILGVATGKSRRGVDKLFEAHDLHPFFMTIQTADNAPSKPHPAMIEQAVLETGIDFSNTVMIGDTGFDMRMARNANVHALGVSWGYHDVEELQAAGAHHIVNDFKELMVQIHGFLQSRDRK